MSRTIFIGDIHGCLYELRALTNALDLYLGDRLVFLGDLVDKGPDSLGVIRQVRLLLSLYPGSVCIAGNHEEKALRFREKGREQEEWADRATEDEWAFLRSLLPLHREKEHGAVAVHGGFFPKFFTRFPGGVGEIPAAWGTRSSAAPACARLWRRPWRRSRRADPDGSLTILMAS